ncbi:MAG: hypothetical protein AAGJ32_04545 [Pseudomonadota bacterium]
MSVQGMMFNAIQAQAVMLKAMVDLSTEAQEITVGALKRAGQRQSSPVEWVSFELPVLNPQSFVNEDIMRATFHRLADQNLRGWEVAADLLKTMPSWLGMSAKMPGTVMTDWFDQVRRTGEAMMPANDAWATSDVVFSAPKRPQAKAEITVQPKTTTASFPTKTAAVAKPKKAEVKSPKAKAKAAKPKQKAPSEPAAKPAAVKADGPSRLSGPRGAADDLTAIKGIGPKIESLLNTIGFYHYDQIASWTAADGRWVDERLAFKGRVSREKWVQQARALAKKAA